MEGFLNTKQQDLNNKPVVQSSSQENNRRVIPGVLVDGVFWYWARKINRHTIQERKGLIVSEKMVNVFSVLLSFVLLILFVYGVVFVLRDNLFITSTWLKPNFYIGIFWLFILSLTFTIFRILDKKTKKHFVPHTKSPVEISLLPSLDIVEKHNRIDKVVTNDFISAVEDAYLLAEKGGYNSTTSVHLFSALAKTTVVKMIFVRLEISFEQLKDPIRRKMQEYEKGEGQINVEVLKNIATAFKNSVEQKSKKVSAVELFYAVYMSDEFIRDLLFSVNVEQEEVENVLAWMRINESMNERYVQFRRSASFKHTGTMNKAFTSVATPFLDSISEDLTRYAVYGRLPMLIERKKEVDEILRAIAGGNRSVVLVGSPGVGKKAIIAGIAERMATEDVPQIMKDKRLVRISIPHIVSASGGSGAEERLLRALQEVGMSGNIILVIDNIHQLIGGFAQGTDLSPVLAAELSKRYTFVISTATPDGYVNNIERSVLAQQLIKIDIHEPDRTSAIHILESKIAGIENKNKVIFSYSAVRDLVDLSDRYMHETFLPEKAILLAKEVGNVVGEKKSDWTIVKNQDVADIISTKTKIPVSNVTQDESEKLLHLEETMHNRLIGQNEAVKAVASALRRSRVSLRAENRPIANFLFLGPTGVGKTELAKTTAEAYFGSEDNMLRFDMSEYQEQSSVYRLIGDNGKGGLLTEAVRKNPFSLLLLDELEKAHPDILNLFLQVMDDGRLTDGLGRTIDFTSVILIATSNAGTQYIMDETAKGTDLEIIKTNLMENELRNVYRPEFLNRFDGVMVFKPLSQDDVVAIAYLMIAKIAKRLEAKGINFRASDEAVYELAQKGYDPKFGARPLRRVVQENVENAVAEYLLKGEAGRRDTLVLKKGGIIEIEKAVQL